MTYNVEGLPEPARFNRSAKLAEIRKRINEMMATKSAPDILVVQEMFSDDAIAKLKALAYPNFIYGPTKADVGGAAMSAVRLAGLSPPPVKLQPSGVAIFSRYPINFRRKRAFGLLTCAGIDCLANKGGLLAQISIPGVPVPLYVATTHMNAQDVSKAPERMHLAAHQQQTRELAALLETSDATGPLIIAGDFNMRSAPKRYQTFKRLIPYPTAHHYCQRHRDQCRSQIPLDQPDPWLTTQDLQFFRDGSAVGIQPEALELRFRTDVARESLSDHSAQLVRWRLRWPMLMTPMPGSCDYQPSLLDRLIPKTGI
jgi:endonuclease/exonuclease/phosphatase family metal-dependent hydrolase